MGGKQKSSIMLVGKHLSSIVHSLRDVRVWRNDVKAIEVFGGWNIRQHVDQLITILRHKSSTRVLLPSENDWDHLLFLLTSIFLEEEQVDYFLLGDQLRWRVDELELLWKESTPLLSSFYRIANALDQKKMNHIALNSGFSVKNDKSLVFLNDGYGVERRYSESSGEFACVSRSFQESNKFIIENKKLDFLSENSSQSDTNNESSWEIFDIHHLNEHFYRIYVLSNQGDHFFIGVTEELFRPFLQSSSEFSQKRPMIRIASFFDSQLRSLLLDVNFVESLSRFCDQLKLEGLYSIEFTRHEVKRDVSFSGQLQYHEVRPFIPENITLLEKIVGQNLLGLHVDSLLGRTCSDLRIRMKWEKPIALLQFYSINDFQFSSRQWRHLSFLERPVEGVVIPPAIQWGMALMEGITIQGIIKKINDGSFYLGVS